MGSLGSAVRDEVGKEVGRSAVCVKESDRVEKRQCPERADIYALVLTHTHTFTQSLPSTITLMIHSDTGISLHRLFLIV